MAITSEERLAAKVTACQAELDVILRSEIAGNAPCAPFQEQRVRQARRNLADALQRLSDRRSHHA